MHINDWTNYSYNITRNFTLSSPEFISSRESNDGSNKSFNRVLKYDYGRNRQARQRNFLISLNKNIYTTVTPIIRSYLYFNTYYPYTHWWVRPYSRYKEMASMTHILKPYYTPVTPIIEAFDFSLHSVFLWAVLNENKTRIRFL